MKIKILAFGIAKEIMNGAVVEQHIKEGLTASELKTLLKEKYPRLQQLNSFMLAVNNKYTNGDELISTTDEVAVIPPVSGG